MSTLFSYYLRLAPKSGNAVRGILVNAGVVDRTYTGTLKVVIANVAHFIDGLLVSAPIQINSGMAIAQLVPEVILDLQECVPADGPFTSTLRSDQGGVNQ